MVRGNQNHSRLDRRRVIEVGGLTGIAAIAGCLGDDDDVDDDDVEDVDDVDDDDAIEDVDDVGDDLGEDDDEVEPTDDVADDEADDDVADLTVHDAKLVYPHNPPIPADVQYNSRAEAADPVPAWIVGTVDKYWLMGFNMIEYQPYGQLVADWSYEPGILEVEFHDDFIWWSGDPVTAEDWVLDLEMRDWFDGGADFDATPAIITYELLEENRVRLALADTWREMWALNQTAADNPLRRIEASRAYNEQWVERFRDTGGDFDAVEDVSEDLRNDGVNDDELVHFFHRPFEFRLDGSIGEVGENYWQFEFVPEKDGVRRHFADEINFRYLRIHVTEEVGVHSEEAFLDGALPWTSSEELADAAEFTTEEQPPFQRLTEPWGISFNAQTHPADVPQFRRAWMYLTDRTKMAEEPPRLYTPFLRDDRVERWVSQDVIDDLTNYGYDAVEWDAAESEMQVGGFERNGDGEWLHQETGEPLEIDFDVWDWSPWMCDIASDLLIDLEDFGFADVECRLEPTLPDDWHVAGRYVGGLFPEWVFSMLFGEDEDWSVPNPNLPESVDAPPVGEPAADPDDWIEYDSRTMGDRLGVTIDDEMYQTLVDELTWVSNQLMLRAPIAGSEISYNTNDHHWDLESPETRPDAWLGLAERHFPWTGAISWVPEEDR